jgi:hypothetical protein
MSDSMIQSLESRRLLSSTVAVNGTELTVNGNGADDSITVRETGGNVHVEWVDSAGSPQAADIGGITAININGGGGSDQIFYTGDSIGANIHGDANGATTPTNNGGGGKGGSKGANKGGSNKGNKNNKGGSKGGSNGNGGGGNGSNVAAGDFITVSDDGTGSSIVHGDAGNDNITLLHGNNTQLFGDQGNDLIFVNTAAQGGSASVDGGAGDDTITTYDGVNNINGGAGNDTLIDVGGLSTNTTTNVENTQSI